MKLTKSENELMQIFWKEDRPLTSVQILELSKGHSWSGQYLHKMLRSLKKQGIIDVCGSIQYGSQYARQFKTLLTKEEVAAKSIISQGLSRDSIAKITMALIKETKKSEKENSDDIIETLEKMIEAYKAENDIEGSSR